MMDSFDNGTLKIRVGDVVQFVDEDNIGDSYTPPMGIAIIVALREGPHRYPIATLAGVDSKGIPVFYERFDTDYVFSL